MTCELSVIVPVFNAAPWLPRCLDALLAQDLPGLEIIVVDDASSDASPDIAASYAARWPKRVRCLRQARNQGPGAARNAGLAVAQGEFVGFADADDDLAPDMFASLCAAARAAGAQMALCGMTVRSARGERVVLPQGIASALDLLRHDKLLPSPWNKIYRRDFILAHKVLFPETRMSEDMAFAFKLLSHAPSLICVPRALYSYTPHEESSLTLDMSKRAEACASLADLKKYLVENNTYQDVKKEYRRMCFLHLAYYPACLLLIDALYKGRNRWRIVRQTPGYLLALSGFLLRRHL